MIEFFFGKSVVDSLKQKKPKNGVLAAQRGEFRYRDRELGGSGTVGDLLVLLCKLCLIYLLSLVYASVLPDFFFFRGGSGVHLIPSEGSNF